MKSMKNILGCVQSRLHCETSNKTCSGKVDMARSKVKNGLAGFLVIISIKKHFQIKIRLQVAKYA